MSEARSSQITTVRCERKKKRKKKQPVYLSLCVIMRKHRLFSVTYTVYTASFLKYNLPPLSAADRVEKQKMLLRQQTSRGGRRNAGHGDLDVILLFCLPFLHTDIMDHCKYGLVEQIHATSGMLHVIIPL